MFRKMIAVVLAAMLITSAAPLSAFAVETEPENGTVAAAETSELPTETEPAVAEPTEAVTIPPVQDEAAETTEEVTTQPVQEKKAEPVGASVDADETVGKSSFTYTVSNDQVTITGLSDEYLTDLVIPEKIEGLPVTAIKESAFSGCSQITSITVPNSVTSIGDGAFKGTNPTKVTLPFIGGSRSTTGYAGVFGYIFGSENVNNSYSASSGTIYQYPNGNYNKYYYFVPKTIKEVIITDDTRVPENAFYNCSWIENIEVNQVSSIGSYAFFQCSSLVSFVIPNSVTSIGTYAFNNCSSLTEISISDNISILSGAVFGGCNKLESFNFPTSLTQIGASAFYNCSSLSETDLVIPDGVTSIGGNAFYGCSTITSITVPNSVTSIGDGAFKGTNPTKVTLPFIGGSRSTTGYAGVFGYIFGSENVNNSYSASSGTIYQYPNGNYNKYYYFVPKTIKEVIITDDTRVPENAFYNCSWIEKVTINDIEGDASVVGNNAFYNCPAMTVYVNRNTGVHTYCERNGIKHCSTKSISLDSDSLVLFRNESNTIGSEVILLNGKVDDDPETVWTSSDTDVVTVNRNTGLITAVAPGTATVAADSEGVTATAEVTVYFKIEGIALNKSTAEIDINKTETLTVIYSPENTTDSRKITWKSSDDKIAQVDENGTVTAHKRGKATITATASNGVKATCTVQVLVPITDITFESDTVSIPRSTRQKVPFTLSPEDYTDTYTVTSSDTEIATVDKFGNVVAKKVGTAVITVTTSRGLEKSCTVKVYSPATAVTLSADSKTIFANRSFELKANLSPSDCTDSVIWSSSDDRIATVDKDGMVTGVSKGCATITATADSGVSADCVVTVESDVNAATVYLEYNETEYSAEDKTPKVFVYFNDERLIEDTDYSLYYYNNHDAGKAGVIVTSLYDGTEVDKAFVIHPLTVTAMEINCQQTMTYTGGELKGVEDVTYQSLRLAEGVDYELKYENNTNVGKATATITGKGNFTGVTTATFTILPRPISEMTVLLESSSYRYDGTEKTPAVTVRYGAKELEEDEDYSVEYTDNLNAGDALVTVSGMGNYSGYVEKPFRIEAKSLSETKLLLDETIYLCDGVEKCPRVTVTDGEIELKKGTDYDVAYKNNTDVGIATVMISGKGNYSGSVYETFEIIMLGDVNADGRVDINDATLVQKAVAELVELDEKQKKAADVTGDGKITIDDATLIQKYVAELIDHFG